MFVFGITFNESVLFLTSSHLTNTALWYFWIMMHYSQVFSKLRLFTFYDGSKKWRYYLRYVVMFTFRIIFSLLFFSGKKSTISFRSFFFQGQFCKHSKSNTKNYLFVKEKSNKKLTFWSIFSETYFQRPWYLT